jgi:hypothetical protein
VKAFWNLRLWLKGGEENTSEKYVNFMFPKKFPSRRRRQEIIIRNEVD